MVFFTCILVQWFLNTYLLMVIWSFWQVCGCGGWRGDEPRKMLSSSSGCWGKLVSLIIIILVVYKYPVKRTLVGSNVDDSFRMLSPSNSKTELEGCRHLNRTDIHSLMSVLLYLIYGWQILAIFLSVKFQLRNRNKFQCNMLILLFQMSWFDNNEYFITEKTCM